MLEGEEEAGPPTVASLYMLLPVSIPVLFFVHSFCFSLSHSCLPLLSSFFMGRKIGWKPVGAACRVPPEYGIFLPWHTILHFSY